MKVTQVAICPSEASTQAGRPALTPELLAASGARYSRNNEGLESILARIDPGNLEKSVDSIFRMVDYGHQSIADMVPVAMFLDGISIWLAYYVWSLCPTAGGQESSTRYLKISADGLISPSELGIPADQMDLWRQSMDQAFDAYQSSLDLWETLAQENSARTQIPKSLLQDTSEQAQKKVARMRRNFAFDRARYFLPVAAATNVMMIMSARGWVNLCQFLLSHPLPEPQQLGKLIRGELAISAPRMMKYARLTESNQQVIAREFEKWIKQAGSTESTGQLSGEPSLSVLLADGISPEEIAGDLAYHTNRYAPTGSSLQRIGVRFGWSSVAFAEIRDLNRHRTGSKHCPQVPKGFYCALDQIPSDARELARNQSQFDKVAAVGSSATDQARTLLRNGDPSYIYWTLLGTEFPFEHITTADKFIYEAELRTGLGAHFRYAKHLRDALALWYRQFPDTQKLILEGSAEPE